MRCVEGSGVPVLYIGRRVPKGYYHNPTELSGPTATPVKWLPGTFSGWQGGRGVALTTLLN
jgi:hypothetical protein